MGATYRNGYGQVFSGIYSKAGHKVPTGAHRAAYEATYGKFDNSLFVLHRCDIPSCVNPDHLFLGTSADNHRDMTMKDRQPSGDRHGMATMTYEIAMKLRDEHIPRVNTYAKLAEKYGLTETAVGAAVRGENWNKPTGVAP